MSADVNEVILDGRHGHVVPAAVSGHPLDRVEFSDMEAALQHAQHGSAFPTMGELPVRNDTLPGQGDHVGPVQLVEPLGRSGVETVTLPEPLAGALHDRAQCADCHEVPDRAGEVHSFFDGARARDAALADAEDGGAR
jgi:hypothetical protein